MTQTTTELKSLIVRESKDLTIAQKLARRGLLRAFSKARYGRLTIADGEDTLLSKALSQVPKPTLRFWIHKPGPTLHFGGRLVAVKPTWEGIGLLAPWIR